VTGTVPPQKYGRLHWFWPAELSPEQRDYYERLTSGPRDKTALTDEHGRLKGAFNARLLDPRLGTAIQEMGAVLRYATPALTGRQRELAILEVARHERSGYEWSAHAAAGRAAGLTGAEIEAVRQGADVPSLAPAEQLARTVVRALLADRDLADELFGRAQQGLGAVAVFDLISLVGHYQHTALALRVWRVPLDSGEEPFLDSDGRSAGA
jgi:alkylhydroperoxidase family enzyme